MGLMVEDNQVKDKDNPASSLSFLSMMRTTPKLMKSMSPNELSNLRRVVNHYMDHFRVHEREYTKNFVLSVNGKLGALNDALNKAGYPRYELQRR